jgi:Na+-transporting methylmalonyl-CoA/oxaloacetate decarboxylase gamma subunit
MVEGITLMIAGMCAVAAGIAFTIAAVWFCRLLVILTVDAYFYVVDRLV